MNPDDLVLTTGGLRYRGRKFPCTIGKAGLSAAKREGDGATPVGIHRIVGVLYRPDRIAPPAPWSAPIRPRDLWSDDPAWQYNQLVTAPFAHSHEALRRADRLYDLVLLTNWNWPDAVPGRGSAIFIHRWRKPGHPTEGCIGLGARHLRWVAHRLRPGARLIVQPLAPKMAEPTRT